MTVTARTLQGQSPWAPRYVGVVWIFLAVIIVLVTGLMIFNARARERLQPLGGDPGEPTRRHWRMRAWG